VFAALASSLLALENPARQETALAVELAETVEI